MLAIPTGQLGCDQSRSATTEEIQHDLTGRHECCIARTTSSKGFSVKWTIDCGLIFFSCCMRKRKYTLAGCFCRGAGWAMGDLDNLQEARVARSF
jgi:hypothetical protein